jgi:hypothetical protein
VKKLSVAVILLALLVAACEEEDTEKTYPPVEKTGPEPALECVQTAFNQRNIDLLKAALNTTFVFYFDEGDVGRTPPGGSQYIVPESWSYTEFWTAVLNLFELAYDVDLYINTPSVGKPAKTDEFYRCEGITTSLRVMIDETNGFTANQGYCDFEFRKYYNEYGEPRWGLTGWWDNTHTAADGYPGTETYSLGMVLAYYK